MQSQVHQLRDGKVAIRTDAGTYLDTLENFALDYGSAFPFWDGPGDGDEAIYEPGVRHPRMSGGNIADAGPMPWPEGDAMIAAAPGLISAKVDRERAVREAAAAAEVVAKATEKRRVDAILEPARARRRQFSSSPDSAALIARLKSASPTQIDNWVDSNVTNIAEARNVLKAIVKILATQVD